MLLRSPKIRNFAWMKHSILSIGMASRLALERLYLLQNKPFEFLGIRVEAMEWIGGAIAIILFVFGIIRWFFKFNLFKRVWSFVKGVKRKISLKIALSQPFDYWMERAKKEIERKEQGIDKTLKTLQSRSNGTSFVGNTIDIAILIMINGKPIVTAYHSSQIMDNSAPGYGILSFTVYTSAGAVATSNGVPIKDIFCYRDSANSGQGDAKITHGFQVPDTYAIVPTYAVNDVDGKLDWVKQASRKITVISIIPSQLNDSEPIISVLLAASHSIEPFFQGAWGWRLAIHNHGDMEDTWESARFIDDFEGAGDAKWGFDPNGGWEPEKFSIPIPAHKTTNKELAYVLPWGTKFKAILKFSSGLTIESNWIAKDTGEPIVENGSESRVGGNSNTQTEI